MEANHKPVGELLDTVARQPKIKRSEYQEHGRFPIIDQSQADIAGYTDDESVLYRGKLPVVIFGDHTRILKFVDFPFCVGADGTQLLRPVEGNDIRYFYYALRNVGLANYGYERHFKYLKEEEVSVPPLPVQRRIADILSAYDELIENNLRRIRILEEMARSHYREWFVHFRYPGHESVLLVDSPHGQIPQGWEVRKLGDVCRSIQDGDWIETKDQGGNDYRLLQISNVGVGEFIETGNYRFVTKETFDRLRCNEIVSGDLLVARMPTPIGRGWLAASMPWKMITAVDVAIIRAQPELVNPLFLVRAWNEQTNLLRIAAQASGTTRLRITRRELATLDFVIPPIEIQQRFADITAPQAELVQALRLKSQILRRARDLLLPRLLSGQIDVKAAETLMEEAIA